MTYFFKKPFAENGDITNIPTNPQGDGGVSYQEGWPEGYELDMQTNPDEAKNLSRTNFNGLFFNITSALQTLQIYGCNPYITASDNDGTPYPYPEGGMCYYTDPATGEIGVYRSLQSNNTDVPSTNGVTSALWRREFNVQLDTLKSNRVSNCVLYYSTFPTYSIDTENSSITITIAAGTKVLLANGIDSTDGTLNNEIFQLLNTETVTYSLTSQFVNKYVFITSNDELLILDTNNYLQYDNLDRVNSQLDGITDYDVYYFDNNLNKWQYRRAGENNFTDLSYSMVNVCSFTGSSIDDINFNYYDPLVIISSEIFGKKMANVQPALITARYSALDNTPEGKQILEINPPTNATPFCINSGNMDSNGDADLLSSESVVIPNTTVSMISSQSGSITSGVPGNPYYQNNGDSYFNAANIDSIYGNNGGYCTVSFSYNYGTVITRDIATIVFDTPIALSSLGCYLHVEIGSYGDYYYSAYDDLEYSGMEAFIDLKFDDNSTFTLSTKNYTQSKPKYAWTSINYNLATYAAAGKKVVSIKVRWSAYMYKFSGGAWRFWGWQIQSFIRGLQIINTMNSIQYQSNKIKFKIGSNYYSTLEENADKMLSSTAGNITAKPTAFSELWFSNNMLEIPSYADGFSSEFTFTSTPEETNNARLVLRYIDQQNNQILGGISIDLEYWGGATYNVVSELTLDRSQDLIFSIPDGKYIKKVSISATQMQYLQNAYIGKLQIYNNISSETLSSLVQYPMLQGTAADTDRTQYTLLDTEDLVVNQSGYLMMTMNKIYLLPGTNVIRKQKKQPTINDDPRLTDGDVWLDYSKEPLIAYQYQNGRWQIFQDIPLGYVTLAWGDPTATATVSGTGITSASVIASTFSQQVGYSGDYVFTYSGSSWQYNGSNVTLSNYGISVTGTPTSGDTITVSYTAAESSIQNLETYPYNQNGYVINTFTENIGSLSGRDGRDGQDGKDGKNGSPGPQGPAGVGIIPGGKTGDLLAKASNADFSMKWTTAVSNALFDGGQAGMTLVKNSSDDLDFSWQNLQVLPEGGQSGEALVKNSSTNYDASWKTIHQIPDGGNSGQVLTKVSSTSQDVAWMNPGGGISQASLRKMDFKTSSYFEASINGYTDLLLEQFIGLDGVAVADRPTVLEYYSAIEANIDNTSGDVLAFGLTAMSFSQAIDYMQVVGDYTGTVTFKYSVDNGETYINFPENQMLQVSTNSLILKIEMADSSVLDNVAIYVK